MSQNSDLVDNVFNTLVSLLTHTEQTDKPKVRLTDKWRERGRNDGCFRYLSLSLGPFLGTEFQCLKRTMNPSVVVRVRSVFLKQRHSLSRNKRLCSRNWKYKEWRVGQRSERALDKVIWGIQHIVDSIDIIFTTYTVHALS